MEKAIPRWTLGQLADLLSAELTGDPNIRIARPVPAGSNDPEGITFSESPKYLSLIENSNVGAAIVGRDIGSIKTPTLRVDDPRAAFFSLLVLAQRSAVPAPGVHPTASVHPTANVHELASIGPHCVIDAGATLEQGACALALVYLGENVHIGANTVLHPGVSVYFDCRIGSGTILHSGVVVGADGFGYAWDGTHQVKIPQVGRVLIGSQCEIGANTCIDRATCGDTVIDDGTKIDNLVQVGHNVQIGKDTVIASLVGISGSSVVGDRVTIGGQVGFNDHTTIGNDVTLGGRTGIVGDILEPGAYFGTPALPVREGLKQMAILRRLPELMDRLKHLEAEVKDLKGRA